MHAYLLNDYWPTSCKAYQQGPLTYRFVLAGDSVTLSSLKVSDDGGAIVARIYNPASKTASVTVRPAKAGAGISPVTPDGLQPVADGRIVVPASATRTIRIG